MPEPSWNTPARIDGLPAKSRKTRATDVSKSGTMAEVVEMFLGLAHHHQRDCSISWGPTAGGDYGSMSAGTIARYVERKKLPPQMAARYENEAAALAILLKVPGPDWHQRASIKRPFNDAAPIGIGPAGKNE